MLMYKNIIGFFSFPFITENVRTGRRERETETETDRQKKREIVEMLTHRGDSAVFLWKLSPFTSFSLGRTLPWFIWFSGRPRNYRGHTFHLNIVYRHASILHVTHVIYATFPPVLRSYVLFTGENRCTSCCFSAPSVQYFYHGIGAETRRYKNGTPNRQV